MGASRVRLHCGSILVRERLSAIEVRENAGWELRLEHRWVAVHVPAARKAGLVQKDTCTEQDGGTLQHGLEAEKRVHRLPCHFGALALDDAVESMPGSAA